MKITEFLGPDAVVATLAGTQKREVLAELCEPIARRDGRISRDRLLDTLVEREKLGSTGIGEGVAIPHGKLASLPTLQASFGRAVAGVDFEAIDGKPTFLFFALFAPENSAGLHLKALARVSRLLKNPALRQAILAAGSAEEIYRLLTDEDAKY